MKSIALIILLILTSTLVSLAQDGTEGQFPDPDLYIWEEVVNGFDNPLYVTHAGDGSGRLFVVEQEGYILVVENGQFNPTPFLDISELLPSIVIQARYTEQGLLGLAFHPDFTKNRRFFINYTNTSGHTEVMQYLVDENDPNRADPLSAQKVLFLEQPLDNHNGGHMTFGPDGYLYIGAGDGGGAGDPNLNGQNTMTLNGTIMRIDVSELPYTVPEDNPYVDTDGYAPEIWAFGLRNPWRYSFDDEAGDLYIADVGQANWEEVDFQPADSPGGENYGWNTYEGYAIYNADLEPASDVTLPIFVYDHSQGCSITGGYVYRGKALPELDGYYFYGDYCGGSIFIAHRDETGQWQTELFMPTDHVISSFGEDENGELLLVDYKGGIYRLARTED
jgi:glucose/arabinose dehydrogenase